MKSGRIHKKDYIKYIESVAKKSKDITIEDLAFEKIFHYTERHPYYVNLLCSRLWRLKKITSKSVEKTWAQYCLEEQSDVANEMDLLSDAQRKLLIALSRSNGTNAPRGKEFQLLSNMPGATIAQALDFLEKKDYVYKTEESYYRVLDPLIKQVLSAS